MSIGDSFNAIYELGQAKVDDKSRLQFLEPQIRKTLRRIDRIISACLAFNDHGVVHKDVDAKGMLRITEVTSLVDDRTRSFKLSPVSVRLKFVRKRMLIDLFKYARASKRLMDFDGTRNNVLGDVSILSVVTFHAQHYIISRPIHFSLHGHLF